jgi:DNA-binding NarL/FixJ family response regulator
MLGLLPGIEVVASAADGRQAIEVVARHQPDAILLDLHMPVMDGIEATRQLTQRHPAVAVVVLTTYADDTSIVAALSAGARGCLTKDTDRVEIASALRSAVSGLSVLADLYLSAHTVKSHINRIFAKTGSADRAAAVRYARDQLLG